MKKLLLSVLMATMLAGAGVAYAQETDGLVEFKNLMAEVKTDIAQLRVEVENGEITQEEAERIRDSYIERLRAEKKAYFDAKYEAKVEKIEVLSEKNPELGAQLMARAEAVQNARSEIESERARIKLALASGEITREEAVAMHAEVRAEYKESRAEAQADFIASVRERNPERAEKMEERMEKQEERLEEKRAKFEAQRAERESKMKERRAEMQARVEARIESGEITREEVEARRENAETQRRLNQDERRVDRVEVRTENRAEVRNNREEARDERREERPQRGASVRTSASVTVE